MFDQGLKIRALSGVDNDKKPRVGSQAVPGVDLVLPYMAGRALQVSNFQNEAFALTKVCG